MPLRVEGRQRGVRFAHTASSCQPVFNHRLHGFPVRSAQSAESVAKNVYCRVL